MHILMLNGSPRKDGNTSVALREMEKVFLEAGFTVETVQVGQMEVRGCLCCGYCFKNGKCAMDDVVNVGR